MLDCVRLIKWVSFNAAFIIGRDYAVLQPQEELGKHRADGKEEEEEEEGFVGL